MEKIHGVKWADRKEISDLLKEGRVTGPFKTVEINKKNLISPGYKRCCRAAAKLARREGCNLIVSQEGVWSESIGGKVTYEFYKLDKKD